MKERMTIRERILAKLNQNNEERQVSTDYVEKAYSILECDVNKTVSVNNLYVLTGQLMAEKNINLDYNQRLGIYIEIAKSLHTKGQNDLAINAIDIAYNHFHEHRPLNLSYEDSTLQRCSFDDECKRLYIYIAADMGCVDAMIFKAQMYSTPAAREHIIENLPQNIRENGTFSEAIKLHQFVNLDTYRALAIFFANQQDLGSYCAVFILSVEYMLITNDQNIGDINCLINYLIRHRTEEVISKKIIDFVISWIHKYEQLSSCCLNYLLELDENNTSLCRVIFNRYCNEVNDPFIHSQALLNKVEMVLKEHGEIMAEDICKLIQIGEMREAINLYRLLGEPNEFNDLMVKSAKSYRVQFVTSVDRDPSKTIALLNFFKFMASKNNIAALAQVLSISCACSFSSLCPCSDDDVRAAATAFENQIANKYALSSMKSADFTEDNITSMLKYFIVPTFQTRTGTYSLFLIIADFLKYFYVIDTEKIIRYFFHHAHSMQDFLTGFIFLFGWWVDIGEDNSNNIEKKLVVLQYISQLKISSNKKINEQMIEILDWQNQKESFLASLSDNELIKLHDAKSVWIQKAIFNRRFIAQKMCYVNKKYLDETVCFIAENRAFTMDDVIKVLYTDDVDNTIKLFKYLDQINETEKVFFDNVERWTQYTFKTPQRQSAHDRAVYSLLNYFVREKKLLRAASMLLQFARTVRENSDVFILNSQLENVVTDIKNIIMSDIALDKDSLINILKYLSISELESMKESTRFEVHKQLCIKYCNEQNTDMQNYDNAIVDQLEWLVSHDSSIGELVEYSAVNHPLATLRFCKKYRPVNGNVKGFDGVAKGIAATDTPHKELLELLMNDAGSSVATMKMAEWAKNYTDPQSSEYAYAKQVYYRLQSLCQRTNLSKEVYLAIAHTFVDGLFGCEINVFQAFIEIYQSIVYNKNTMTIQESEFLTTYCTGLFEEMYMQDSRVCWLLTFYQSLTAHFDPTRYMEMIVKASEAGISSATWQCFHALDIGENEFYRDNNLAFKFLLRYVLLMNGPQQEMQMVKNAFMVQGVEVTEDEIFEMGRAVQPEKEFLERFESLKKKQYHKR